MKKPGFGWFAARAGSGGKRREVSSASMSLQLKALCAFALGVGAGFAAGCQTYDFEPVEPLAIAQTTQSKKVVAKQLKPNLMLLVDTSGSMNTGSPNSRLYELQTAMKTFLGGFQQNPVARVGVVVYPQSGGDGCNPTLPEDITTPGRGVPIPAGDDDATLKQAAQQVDSTIQNLKANGGTPTAASLAVVGNYAPLQATDRDQFVLLLTDGLPNCNPSHAPNNCGGGNGCTKLCADASWQPGQGCCTITSCPDGSYCAKGCLDDSGTVAAIKALRAKGIKTIVVGFGADLVSGPGPITLNAMAEQGGFARACPNGTNAECGAGNTCEATKVCTKKYYQASNSQELAAALLQISQILGSDPCQYTLESTPSDPKFLSVLIDGKSTPSGPDTWKYEAGKVVFTGSLCTQVSSATPTKPVMVEFRIVCVPGEPGC